MTRTMLATLLALAVPLPATPVSVGDLGTKTRDTYSREPPFSKNAFTAMAR